MNQAEFFQQHAVDGVLPPQFMAQLLTSGLPAEGDTPAVQADIDEPPVVEAAATPTPAPAPAAPAAAPEPAPQPVLLAKDGVHTIPFSQLEAARQQANDLAAQNAQLQAQLAAAAQAPATAPAAPTPATVDVDKLREGVDFGDYSDEAIAKATAVIAARAAEQAAQAAIDRFAATQPQPVDPAIQAHLTAIYTAHPNLDSMVMSQEFAAWRATQPSFAQPGIDHVLADGQTQEVIDLFNAYKAGTTQPAPPPAAPAAAPAPGAAAEAQAAAAIAAAKAKPPTSLSEIPAGSQVHVDPTAALLQATPRQLMDRMAQMSPAEIEALVARAL